VTSSARELAEIIYHARFNGSLEDFITQLQDEARALMQQEVAALVRKELSDELGTELSQAILALFPSHAEAMAEHDRQVRLEEVKSIPVHVWPDSVDAQKSWNMYRTMRIETLEAGLRGKKETQP
jgi:hypothetical protein